MRSPACQRTRFTTRRSTTRTRWPSQEYSEREAIASTSISTAQYVLSRLCAQSTMDQFHSSALDRPAPQQDHGYPLDRPVYRPHDKVTKLLTSSMARQSRFATPNIYDDEPQLRPLSSLSTSAHIVHNLTPYFTHKLHLHSPR